MVCGSIRTTAIGRPSSTSLSVSPGVVTSPPTARWPGGCVSAESPPAAGGAGSAATRPGRGDAAVGCGGSVAAHAEAATASRMVDSARLTVIADSEPLTRQLRLPRLREALDDLLEKLARRGLRRQLLLAERLFVQRGRDLVALRPQGFDARVLGGRAVELRLGEERFPDAVLRVVGELGGREATHEIAESLERESVASLREVLIRLVVELVRVALRRRDRRRRRPLAELREAAHHLVELVVEPAHLIEQLLRGVAAGRLGAEQDVALLRQLAPRVPQHGVRDRVANAHGLDLRAQAVEARAQQAELRRVASGQHRGERREGDP